MTVKQLTEIVNGRLKPSTAALDADIIEVSKEQGNALQVKEDGLYYKESIVVDGDDALNVVSGKLNIVVSPARDNILQKTAEGLYVPTQGNPHNITTSDIDEGTNLFFTESRVNQTVLTGLDTSTATPVLDTDQILAAIGKLQAQINNISSGGGIAFYPSFAGNAGKVLTVNATEDGVEWVTISNGDNPPDGGGENIPDNDFTKVTYIKTDTSNPMWVGAEYAPENINGELHIDWGDGTKEVLKVVDYEEDGYSLHLEHEYAVNGEYVVKVYSTTEASYTGFGEITKVIDWGSPSNLQPLYFTSENLIEVPSTLHPELTNLNSMFSSSTNFNQDISTWDVSNVTDMTYMFQNARAFNSDISGWDVSNVVGMMGMFSEARAFNQDISVWNTKNATNMDNMFQNCRAFKQDLSGWCVTKITTEPTNFATNSGLTLKPVWGTCPSREIYADDESILELQEGTFITISGGTLTFANGSSTVFTPGTSTTYSVTAAQVGKANFKNTSANYVARGTSLVKVLHYPRNATTISHENSPNLIEVPAHLPSDVTVLTSTFIGCSSFNHPNISKWDTSKVTSMSGMFYNCVNFNQSLNNWNVGNVTSMASMFYGCSVFNQPLNDWNTTNVTDMYNMFWLCIAFNQPLDNWDTSSVTTMRGMFSNCTLFNQSLNSWNTSSVTSMADMFRNCTNFNQNINSWDTSKVTIMNFMFLGCSSFDQPLDNWNVSSVIAMTSMFNGCTMFNQPLNTWNTGKVIGMNSMFYNCTNFNQDISSWCVPLIVSKPTNFSSGTNLPLAYEPVWGTCPIS